MSVRSPCLLALAVNLLAGGLWTAGTARAQDVDPDLFAPVASSAGLISVHASDVLPHLSFSAWLTASYARDLLVGTAPDGSLARLVAGRVGLEASVGVGLLDRLEVVVSLPVRLAQWADGDKSIDGGAVSGLGDVRIAPRFRILRGDRHSGFGLAIAADVTAPTGRAGARMGDASATFTPRVVADWRSSGGLLAAVNVGYRVRRAWTVRDLVVDDEVRLGAAVEAPFGWAGLSVLAEVTAAIGVGEILPGQDRISLARAPVEVHGAARWRSRGGFIVTAGAGSGVTRGYGAPDVRLFASVGYALPFGSSPAGEGDATSPHPVSGDEDPGAAAGPGVAPPGAQPIGVPVEPVAPPVLGGTRPADLSAFDRAVAGDPDPDRDGVPVGRDRCQDRAEDPDGFEDDDGCPDEDDDRDGIPDSADACRLQPEVYNGNADEDGCPDEGGSAVTLARDKLVIGQRVFFQTGSDVLMPESHAVLRQVAGFLKANWAVRRVRVDGHTDDVGDRERNVDLSERRARQVVAFLAAEGVASARLDAKGFGPKAPVASNRTEAGRAQNRRVEFTILETVGTEAGQ